MRKKFDLKSYSKLLFLIFSIVLVMLGQTILGDRIKYPFSYVFSPIHVSGSSAGKRVNNWKEALIDASSYIKEFNNMKEEIAKLKVENSEKLLDYDEYLSLKEQSTFITNEAKYIQAKIISNTSDGSILINVGKEKGIEVGDNVVLGRVYIGMVSDVTLYSSRVKLPLNPSSSFEVVVLPGSINLNKENRIDSMVKSIGVVIGKSDSILIENLGINSDVKDGDFVLIRDNRVGDLFVLGTLIGVSNNPASTNKSGFVSPIFDYGNILNVYVLKK